MKVFKYIIFLLLFLLYVLKIGAQNNHASVITPEIDSVLTKIDEALKKERLEGLDIRLDSLKKTKNYKERRYDKLAVEIIYARYLYENEQSEKAIHLLLDIFTELQNKKSTKLYWRCAKDLGLIYEKSRLFDQADIYYNISLLNASRRKDTCDLLESYKNKASNFLEGTRNYYDHEKEMKQLQDSVLLYCDKVIKLDFSRKSNKLMASIYNYLSNIYIIKKNFSLGNYYAKEYLEINKGLKDSLGISIAYNAYANTYFVVDKYEKAIEYYKKSLKYIEHIKSRKAVLVKEALLQNISWSYSELKNFEQGYIYQEKATEYADSLETIDHFRNIAGIESKYLESQKVEQEKNKRLRTQASLYGLSFFTSLLLFVSYIIYKKLRTKQLRTENKIIGLKFKALNAQMNPHFINNLLTAIHHLINNNKKDDAVLNLKKFSKLTHLVLHSTKTNLISLKEELEILKLYLDLQLVRYENKFKYIINLDELSHNDLDTIRIPPLILQPLVENSIVHGFSTIKEKGKILIHFSFNDEEYLQCTITDNGTPQNYSSKIHNGAGVSMKNINERLNLIDEELSNRQLLTFSKVKNNEINKVIGSKTQLNIPLIYY